MMHPPAIKKQTSALACTDCKKEYPTIIEDYVNGDYICADCGLVLGGRIIDQHTEWRTFSNDKEPHKDQSRVGGTYDPTLNPTNDLSTRITSGTDDSFGMLSRLQSKTAGAAGDRAVQNAFKQISTIGDRMQLSQSIVLQAKRNYRKVWQNKNIKGRTNQNGVYGACIYVACRQEGVPRTFKEVCATVESTNKEIGKCFKIIAKLMNGEMGDRTLSTINTDQFMDRFCSKLNLDIKIRMEATRIAKKATELGLCGGKSPISIASGAIYMACQLNEILRTPAEIGEITKVTEATVKLAHKDLVKNRDLLVKDSTASPSTNASTPAGSTPS